MRSIFVIKKQLTKPQELTQVTKKSKQTNKNAANYQFILSEALNSLLSFRIDEPALLQFVGFLFITLLPVHKYINNKKETVNSECKKKNKV